MKIKLFQLGSISWIILYFFSHFSLAQDTLEIKNLNSYPVREYLQVLEADPEASEEFVFAQFMRGDFKPLYTTKPFNRGVTSNIWWFALPIRNSLDITNSVILMAATQSASLITLFEEKEGRLIPTDFTGYSIPSSERSLDTRLFSFELKMEPYEEKLYFVSVDTEGGNLYIPFYIDEPSHYWAYETTRATHYGFIIGIFFLAFMISLFLWVKTGESIYGYYVTYIILSFLLILEEDGYAFWWLYGDYFPQLGLVLIPLTATLGMVLLLQIMLKFHYYSSHDLTAYRFTKIAQGTLLLLALINLLFLFFPFSNVFRSLVYNLSFIGVVIGAFTAWGGSILKLAQGFKPAKVYLLAVSIMIVGLLNYSLNTLSITNFNLFYPNGIVVGISLEIIIMIFALAYRYLEMKREKEELLLTLNKERAVVSEKILQTLENERERLAKDLHDDLGGLLALIKMQLSHFSYSNPVRGSDLNETYSLVSKACNDLRAISHDLRLEDQKNRDLCSMLQEIIRHHEKGGELRFNTIFKNVPPLKFDTKITIFRMLKEVIQNVSKHAKATECKILIIFDKEILHIMVEDNGVGFQETYAGDNKGIGLVNIRSRIDYLEGKMQIQSNSDGTTLLFEIPIGESININEISYGAHSNTFSNSR